MALTARVKKLLRDSVKQRTRIQKQAELREVTGDDDYESTAIRQKAWDNITAASRRAADKFLREESRKRLVYKTLRFKYRPSKWARLFHTAKNSRGLKIRLRILIWGIKSGKTQAGAVEFCRHVLDNPKQHGWVVCPSLKQTETCEEMVKDILFSKDGIVTRYNETKRKMTLFNGSIIEFRTAKNPDALRGPNIHIAWLDEGAFLEHKAYLEVRKRTAATKGLILITTTPNGKNWVWNECVESHKYPGLMPPAAPYGEFCYFDKNAVAQKWVSHRPTWHFPWVDEEELEEQRFGSTQEYFDQEWGALFTANQNAAFKSVSKILVSDLLPGYTDTKKYVMGVDLGRKKDYTAVVVLDQNGRAVHVERWRYVGWKHTRVRIKELSEAWGKAPIIIDSSNLGDVIQEDLDNDGYKIHKCELNSWRIKNAIIEALQIGIEQGGMGITDPLFPDCTADERSLVAELQDYQANLTGGSRVSYAAPKGRHDDLVLALAMAYWGKKLGYAGGLSYDAVVCSKLADTDLTVLERMNKRRERANSRLSRSRVFGGNYTRLHRGIPLKSVWR